MNQRTRISKQQVSRLLSFGKIHDEVKDDIAKLQKARRLLRQNKFDQSLRILKALENSQVRQIRVHSRFYIGELLFTQQEYDLAMQVFEEILKKDA